MHHRKYIAINSSNLVLFLLLGLNVFCSCCGYKVQSAVGHLPAEMKSLGIPTFVNATKRYKIEQWITQAVVDEFALRTRAIIRSGSSNVESVLLGEIQSVNSEPVTFGTQEVGSQTFGSAFLVTVRAKVRLIRLKDSAVLWESDDFLHRERYVLNTSVADFFDEENPALKRLARDFASRLASTILNRSMP